MRFLLDENVPIQIGLLLRNLNHDVLIVRRSPLRGAKDPEIWTFAAREQRVIITHDKGLPAAGTADPPAGVILVRPHDHRPAFIEALFRDFWSKVTEADILDRIVTVQAGRFRTRPLKPLKLPKRQR